MELQELVTQWPLQRFHDFLGYTSFLACKVPQQKQNSIRSAQALLWYGVVWYGVGCHCQAGRPPSSLKGKPSASKEQSAPPSCHHLCLIPLRQSRKPGTLSSAALHFDINQRDRDRQTNRQTLQRSPPAALLEGCSPDSSQLP